MARPAVFINPDLNTPEDIARAQALLGALAPNYGKAANVGEGIAQLMIGIGSGVKNRKIAKAETAGRAQGNSAFEKIMGAMSGANNRFPDAPSQDSSTAQPQITSNNEAVKTMLGGGAVEGTAGNARAVDRASMAGYSGDVIQQASKYGVDGSIPGKIVETANAIGADPIDLATVISYETGGTFDPTKRGPTTQYGQHRGLIQFGEPQAAKLGVDWNNPIDSQLGANGAVAKYFQGAGYKPGMGMLDLYSAVNAGSVGRYNASDANNGGAPGTVRDKVTGQMAGHRAKAEKLLAALQGQGQTQIAAAPNAYFPKMMASSQQPQNAQVASLDPSIGMPEQPQQMYVGQVNPNGSISTVAQKPGIQAIAAAMGNPAPNGMAAPQQAPAPQQMAQAAPSDIPAMPQNEASSLDRIIGMNTPLGAPQPQGLDVGMLMQAAQNPWLTDTQKTMVNTLLQQEMQKQDPAYQMQQQAAQLGIQKDQLQLDQMRDPSKVPMTPMQQLQLQKSQLELQQMQNPTPKEPTTEITDVNGKRVLVNRATGETIRDLGDSPSKQQNAPAGYQMNPDGKTMSRIPGYRDTNLEMDMRKEFDGLSKDFRAVRDSYNRIQASAENPTPAGDLSLIFNYMKMLDPGSVVREAEFATAANAAPLLTRFGLDAEKLKGVWEGQRLTPEQRADFLTRSDQLYQEQDQTFQTLADQYTETAKRNDLAPENIILTPRANPRKKKTAPNAAPEGVDPSAWEYMTPEERALWK